MRPFDLTKFKKDFTKKHGVQFGFYDPVNWIDTGNYALNYRLSGSFKKGFPLDGKVCVIAGESGSGKSYVASGNCTRAALEAGMNVCMLDSEDGLDAAWMRKMGIDPEHPRLTKMPVSSPDDVANFIDAYMKDYKTQMAGAEREEQQPTLFVVDSLGMLMTKSDQEQFSNGDMRGSFGQKAKQLKALVSNCIRLFQGHPVGMIVTNHTYISNDMFKPGDVVSGGNGFIFAASLIVVLNKLKLKEDEEGNKVSQVLGIRAKAQVVKSRYSKPFEEIEVFIPYETGMARHSGLFEMFEKAGVFVKAGNKYEWTSKSGAAHKLYRKEWLKSHEILEQVMTEYEEKGETGSAGFGDELETYFDKDPELHEH